MNVRPLKIKDLLVIEPRVFGDNRGFFKETWNHDDFETAGVPGGYVQDNLSKSPKGVLRGLHYQHPKGQGKLVTVLRGEVYDVALDIRRGSPTFGQWEGVILSGENHLQFYVPPGFAHGFEVLSEEAYFFYKCTEFYHPQFEYSVLWNDPELAIPWKNDTPVLSPKDKEAPRLRDIPEEKLPAAPT